MEWLLGGEREGLGRLFGRRREKDFDLAWLFLVEYFEVLGVSCLGGRRGFGGRLFDDESVEAIPLA